MAKSLYDILEVSASASYEAIRAAYERLSRKYDPDLDEHRGNAETRLRHEAVKEAFFTLGNTQKRARYDRSLVDAAVSTPSTLDIQDSAWTMPKILVIVAALLLGGGWYMSHKHNEQKLAAERAIAEARAKEAESKAKAEAEAAEQERIALQRERELERKRTYQESRTRSEFERANREFERERRRQEFTDRYTQERQKHEEQSASRRSEMERQRRDAFDVAEAQRRQPGYDPRVLVEAGGHAQRVRKVQWANLYRRHRHVAGDAPQHQPPRRVRLGQSQGSQGALVGRLRIKALEGGEEQLGV